MSFFEWLNSCDLQTRTSTTTAEHSDRHKAIVRKPFMTRLYVYHIFLMTDGALRWSPGGQFPHRVYAASNIFACQAKQREVGVKQIVKQPARIEYAVSRTRCYQYHEYTISKLSVQGAAHSIEKAGRSRGLLYSYFSFGRSPHTCGSGYILGVATVASLVTNLLKRSLASANFKKEQPVSLRPKGSLSLT